jgi:endonuclease YncB( thermonuclease family)
MVVMSRSRHPRPWLLVSLWVALLAGAMVTGACASTTTQRSTTGITASSSTTATTAALSTSSSDAAFSTFAAPEPGQPLLALVVDVIDGDTMVVVLHLGEGLREEVRLTGIDAPESGEVFADSATRALERLTSEKGFDVWLEIGDEMRDQYGRLLAYAFQFDDSTGKGPFINAELLRRGLATVFTVEPNTKYGDALQQAQEEAQTARTGIWAAAKPSPLEIVRVEYDPPGDDTLDLNGEYIVFRVLTAGDLRGYAVEDESGKHFGFPSRVYQRGQIITLHSDHGTDTSADLYWGVSGSAIWNNGGDTVKLLDPQGHIVASHNY